ncbi:hypothetical protein [Pleomorphochaeta sp. DL1XJH-081]|uniref:hypothetical protein n=1 Tax=Pleomorphochaeta sp. DL1XJH-081 TaxID=3409690 RepID=UPI003BB6B7B3
MKKIMILSIAILLILFSPVFAEVPNRIEETIYSIAAYSGKDYALTFAKQDSSTIFIHADVDNFASLKKNFIYFWPITDQWLVDDSILDITYKGTLEITDKNGNIIPIETVNYTFYNMRGTYDNNWHIKTGTEAEEEWNDYIELVLAYQEAVSNYNRAYTAYQQRTSELFNQILQIKAEGKPYEHLLQEMENIKQPSEPEPPKKYTVPPIRLQKGYPINLPEGEYTIQLKTPSGNILEGSEKKLISIKGRRTNSIGYEIFPAVRWTQPTNSTTPASVLYVDGTSDLYVRPFFQTEYKDLQYNKMINNQESGNPNLYRWVKIQQVPDSGISVTSENQAIEIYEEPYIVEQSKTTALGYTIAPYDPTGEHVGKTPSISALHIPLNPMMHELEFSLLGLEDPKAIATSGRVIRIISGIQNETITVVLIILPILALLLVFSVRRKTYQ